MRTWQMAPSREERRAPAYHRRSRQRTDAVNTGSDADRKDEVESERARARVPSQHVGRLAVAVSALRRAPLRRRRRL